MNNYPFYPNRDDSPSFDTFPDPYSAQQFMPMPSNRPLPPPPGGPMQPFPPGGPPPHGGPMPFPPGGQPPHGGPGPFPPGGQPPHGGPGPYPPGGQPPQPFGPPPQFTPAYPSSLHQQGSRGIRRCLYRNTYIWMNDRSSFWFFPTFVLGSIVYGYRWGRFGWMYSIINGNNIRSFQCF